MATPKTTGASFEALADEYTDLLETVIINKSARPTSRPRPKRALANEARYQAVEDTTGVPWDWIASVPSLGASFDFSTHLHNGDPLTGRTTHEPKTDPTAQIMKLGARPVEEGAIIFRSGDQLYFVDAVPVGGARMLNSFRDAFAPPG